MVKFQARLIFAVAIVFSIISGSKCSRGAAVGDASVDAVVKKMIDEANAAFNPDGMGRIDLSRPHPPVNSLGVETAPQVLRAMSGRLTGDIIKDTYIRYHLLYVVTLAVNSGNDKLVADLTKLESSLPTDIKVVDKPWSTTDHPEIEGKYYALINQCYVDTGYPPFVKRVGPPESFQYMDAGRKAKAQQDYAEAQQLLTKFKRIDLPANGAYNTRAGGMKWIIRQYRGEVLYDLVASGDRPSLLKMTDAIVETAGKDLIRATDLASFLNAAYINGMLGKFKKEDFKFILPKLKQAIAESSPRDPNDKAKPKANGPSPAASLGGWVSVDVSGRPERKLAEELFTVVTAIDNDRMGTPILLENRNRPSADADAVPPVAPATTQPATKISPNEITLDMVNAAIDRGVSALEKLRLPDEDLGVNSYTSIALGTNYWNACYAHPGNTALSTWAMLNSVETGQVPWLQRRVNWVNCYDTPDTFDRVMRLEMLSTFRSKWVTPWIKHDSQWLLDTMTDEGGWDSTNTGGKNGGGDNANGQYAVMGLWAAEQSGEAIPDAAWKKIDGYWRKAQHNGGADSGGWATGGAVKADAKDFSNLVTAPMTAGGCLSLFLTEMYLYGPSRIELGQSLSPDLMEGLKWLDGNMSLDKIDGDSDFYYYAWTLQNVGQTTGYRKFNKIDWFREVTARLLNSQQLDGTWTGPKSINVSTSFALLYLARARGPLAICKVRFGATGLGGSWDNRPNDLYNLATDFGHRFETPTSWQIADLDQPVYELIESPMLYLATDKQFKLAPEQVQRLKEYIDAGGLLVCVPEGAKPDDATASMKSLAKDLCPGIEPIHREDLSDPFFSLGAKLKKAIPIISYENVVRPRVLIVGADLSRGLQADSQADRTAFDLLSNIYMYVSGRNPQRARLDQNFIQQRKQGPTTRMSVARVKCQGDFDPEPSAMPQIKAMMAERHDLNLDITSVDPAELNAGTKIAFLSASAQASLSDEQAAALKKWVDAGGTLWLDAAGGSDEAVHSLDKMNKQLGINSESLLPISDSAIFTGKGLAGGYEISNLEYRAYHKEKPALLGMTVNGRIAMLVFRGDIISGLAGLNHWGIAGLTPKSARQIVANSVMMLRPPPPATRPSTLPSTAPSTRPIPS